MKEIVICPGSIKIVAKMPVKEENLEAFCRLAGELVEKSREEAGNVYYSLNVSKKDPCLLTFLECWADKAALKAHNSTEHFTRILPQLLVLCSGEPTTELYIEL